MDGTQQSEKKGNPNNKKSGSKTFYQEFITKQNQKQMMDSNRTVDTKNPDNQSPKGSPFLNKPKPKQKYKKSQIQPIIALKNSVDITKKSTDIERKPTMTNLARLNNIIDDEEYTNFTKNKKFDGYRKIDDKMGYKNEGIKFFSDINEETNFFQFFCYKKVEFWRKLFMIIHFLAALSSITYTLISLINKILSCSLKLEQIIIQSIFFLVGIVLKFGAYNFAYQELYGVLSYNIKIPMFLPMLISLATPGMLLAIYIGYSYNEASQTCIYESNILTEKEQEAYTINLFQSIMSWLVSLLFTLFIQLIFNKCIGRRAKALINAWYAIMGTTFYFMLVCMCIMSFLNLISHVPNWATAVEIINLGFYIISCVIIAVILSKRGLDFLPSLWKLKDQEEILKEKIVEDQENYNEPNKNEGKDIDNNDKNSEEEEKYYNNN